MGETEITIFVVLSNVILMIFITGIILFVLQYRARRIRHEKEKGEIEKQHKLNLLNTQLQIQQQTMQFIGQEIHDSVAQKLTLASIYTQRLEFSAQSSVDREKLTGVNKILNDSLLELKQLSRSLTDDKLQGAGLQQLISLECDQVNATNICTAGFTFNALPDISIAIKSSLLRIVQEFIQNSIRHSGCKEIKINLEVDTKELTMLLEDDGRGFDFQNPDHKGIGLDSIRRRIQSLGGEYNFTGNAGKGVRLHLTVPLNIAND